MKSSRKTDAKPPTAAVPSNLVSFSTGQGTTIGMAAIEAAGAARRKAAIEAEVGPELPLF